MQRLKKVGADIINSDKLIYSFVRAAASSQTASWADMLLSFALFKWCGLDPWISTAIGAVVGGIINCIINFRFTFHAQGCSWKAVAVKYAMVWLGSVMLNSFGTEALYYLLNLWQWLKEVGFDDDWIFAAARLSTSLLVSWFWNFVLQRYFVYRVTAFDKHAIALVDFFAFKKKRTEKENQTH